MTMTTIDVSRLDRVTEKAMMLTNRNRNPTMTQTVMPAVNTKWSVEKRVKSCFSSCLWIFQEKILAKRRRGRGALEYYIKWVGYDASANEWIPETSLNCPERVAEFERKEKQASKAKNSRRRTHPARNSHRTKRRRVKIIDEYDDDEEEEITKSVASSISSSSKSTTLNISSRSVQYGVEKGYKVQAVLGINRTKGEQLHYLVHYQAPTSFEDNMELIPADVAKRFCEDEIIQFYETRITWNERRSE